MDRHSMKENARDHCIRSLSKNINFEFIFMMFMFGKIAEN